MSGYFRKATSMLIGCVVVGACSSTALAASCYYTSVWRPQHETTEKHLITETQTLENEVAKAGADTLEQVLAALKVVNRQASGEGSRQQEVTRKSQEAYASTINEQTRRERLVAIKENYSYETGQGVNACAQVAFMGNVVDALDGARGSASTIYKSLDISPGKTPTPAEQASARLDPSSTDARVVLGIANRDQKVKFIQQLSGFALNKPTGALVGTAAGEFDLIRARRAEAWRSPALVSISYVAGLTDKGIGSGDSEGSVFQAMDSLIDNYGGGPAYDKWTNGLQMQSERGLVVELNRLRSLSMRLRTQLSESQARQAAVTSALLAAEATGGN